MYSSLEKRIGKIEDTCPYRMHLSFELISSFVCNKIRFGYFLRKMKKDNTLIMIILNFISLAQNNLTFEHVFYESHLKYSLRKSGSIQVLNFQEKKSFSNKTLRKNH